MAVYTHLSDEAIAAFVAQQYEIGELQLALGIAEGVENTNYLIETCKAGEVHKYILTLYEKRVDAKDLPFFIGLMDHLSQKGFPCPEPIRNRKGEVLGELSDRPAAMVSFLPGRAHSVIRNPYLKALGGALAKLHLEAGDFTMRRENNLSLEGWSRLFDQLKDRLDEIEDGLAQTVSDELQYLSEHWPDDLPKGIIHADAFPDNVFFEKDRLSGVIDFYFSCHDILAYELAICLNCWCFEPSGEFNITKSSLLCKHYHRIRPLSEEEKEALPLLARGAALRFLLTRAYDHLNHDISALVQPKDPLEYVRKLRFHQQATSHREYGL